MTYQTIDAHQHFWKFDPVRDSWIDETMPGIQRDFLPQDLEPVLRQFGIQGTVTVQSTLTEEENYFHLANAEASPFIRGIVGWTNLCNPAVEERLADFRQYPKMKGFRHILQAENQRDYMLLPSFMNGIRLLEKFGFTYDILIFPDQLGFTTQFVRAFPNQRFVIDHIAKPSIREKSFDYWAGGIKEIARHENVFCKISGMVTEGDWLQWKTTDFIPYVDHIVKCFGTGRIMFGSDWPVCLVAADYGEVKAIVDSYFSGFSLEEKSDFFGRNATGFYNL